MTVTPAQLEDDPNLPDKVKRFVQEAQDEARNGPKPPPPPGSVDDGVK